MSLKVRIKDTSVVVQKVCLVKINTVKLNANFFFFSSRALYFNFICV